MQDEQQTLKEETCIDFKESKTVNEPLARKDPYSKQNSIEAPHKDLTITGKETIAFNPRYSFRDVLEDLSTHEIIRRE